MKQIIKHPIIKNPVFRRMFSVATAFIVFGIIDNGIMILAGSSIDSTLSVVLGISTMASAGLGNTLSDMMGIILGRYTEKTVYNIFPVDTTTKLSNTRTVFSEALGIVVGCLIGMLPLLLF